MILLLSACSGTNFLPWTDDAILPLARGGRLLLPGGAPLEDAEACRFLRQADYVIMGEQHDKAEDHASQAMLLGMLASCGADPVLGLEMLDVETQPILDKFNAGELGSDPEDLDALAQALHWSAKVGIPFDLYRPVFVMAARRKIPVHALNLPRRVVRATRLHGVAGVAPEDKKYLPERIMEASLEQQAKLTQIFSAHLGIASPSNRQQSDQVSIQRFILAQSLWDSAMAGQSRRIREREQKTVLILAGTGHVEYRWGIALRLTSLEPAARILSIMPWRGPVAEAAFLRADRADCYYYAPFRE